MQTLDINHICKRIRRGELVRDTDESGALGFWDLAGESARSVYPGGFYGKQGNEFEALQEKLYNQFWEIYEARGR